MGPKIVAISGIDGAGKSTLINELETTLSRQGYNVDSVYGRYVPHLALPFIAAGEKFIINKDYQEEFASHMEKKREFFSSAATRYSYEAIVFVDYITRIWYDYLQRVYQDILLFDRCLIDTILKNFEGKIIHGTEESFTKYKLYSRMVPSCDEVFYLDISIETALERKDDIPTRAYICRQKHNYEQFFERVDHHRLDGERSIGELLEIVIETIQ